MISRGVSAAGDRSRAERSVVFEHSIIAEVGDIEIAEFVDRDAGRVLQAILGGGAAVVGGIRDEVAELTEHPARSEGAGGDRSVIFEHAVVAGIRDIQVV